MNEIRFIAEKNIAFRINVISFILLLATLIMLVFPGFITIIGNSIIGIIGVVLYRYYLKIKNKEIQKIVMNSESFTFYFFSYFTKSKVISKDELELFITSNKIVFRDICLSRGIGLVYKNNVESLEMENCLNELIVKIPNSI